MTSLISPPVVLVGAASAAFLALHGLLWYARPASGLWLFGSIVLGLLWGIAFMRLITREAAP